ncbi:SDR family oxidoreductase [Glutamicibacter sp. MNS18]|uniref:SDR family oxidoreductase n=1 Tax=Glutamicibacter sp. MNS18 TaxID=2989817 RepID=UPI00223666FE|nr:SDR family oxidoreductase [Glutamicibacter sp. MNS18]MCW4465686.1 SDR family oxidoreductase [Glutamicibacter sp. MNS18]
MAEERRVVIVGGHGKVALLAAPRLVREGFAVDSFIRNPEHAKDVTAVGANPIQLDVEQTGTQALAEAFAGADAVVFSAGAGGGNPERTHAVDYEAAIRTMEAAKQAGVKRYVMVSYSRSAVDLDSLSPQDSFYPYAKAKHDADEYLRATSLDYTILGPGMLTLNPATSKLTLVDSQGRVAGKQPSGSESETARENVAEVIAYVLAHDSAIRQTVNFFDGQTPIRKIFS